MKKSPELIIFTGNVGCGKSTMAAKMAKNGFVIINGDLITIMVQGGEYGAYDPKKKPVYHAIERAGIETALERGFSVVVDRTNMKVSDRARFVEMGKKYDVAIKSYCWGPGSNIALRRRLDDPKGIPESQWEDVFNRMYASYEKPDRDEGFDSISFLDVDGGLIYEKGKANFTT